LLELAEQLGIGVELRPIELEAAYAAEELFISSSIRELLPVVCLDGHTIGAASPGPIYRRLLEAFRGRTRTPGAAPS
jgi:branched-subunit amino acid aminotransferase/4-amino-4-deoxychorismate lyase